MNRNAKRMAAEDTAVSRMSGRGKGRPRVTSREKIVEAGLAIAASDPSATVSVVSIARKLGIAPMAIYNYFPNKDALMQELSARLLEEMTIDMPTGTAPLAAIENWARSMRAHFLRRPELLRVLGYENGYISIAWLAKSRSLFEAMEDLGFTGDDLVKSVLWLWNVVMSAITVEIEERLSPPPVTEHMADRLDSYMNKVWSVMTQAREDPDFHDELFEFHIAMALDGLKSILASGNAEQSTPKA